MKTAGDEFWAALREELPNIARELEDGDGLIVIPETMLRYFEGLPGWTGGSPNAPHPLVVTPSNKEAMHCGCINSDIGVIRAILY